MGWLCYADLATVAPPTIVSLIMQCDVTVFWCTAAVHCASVVSWFAVVVSRSTVGVFLCYSIFVYSHGGSCVLLFPGVSNQAGCVVLCFSCVSVFCVLASSRLASFSWLAAGCLLEWACGQGDGCGSRRSHSSFVPLSTADPQQQQY